MSKHSKENNTSPARMVFLILLFFAFAGAVWSLVTGNSDFSKRSRDASAAEAADSADDLRAGGDAEGNTPAEENRMIFGQVPQSTDNAKAEAVQSAVTGETGNGAQAEAAQPAVTGTSGNDTTPSAGSGSESSHGSAAGETGSAAPADAAEELLLVNKTHHLEADYWPDDMVTVSSCVEGVGNNDTKKLRKVAADALEKLIAGAAAEGYQIKMRTGFRSYDYQVTLFSSYARKNGEEAANKYSARAGESEHQSGLCCDVSSPSVGWAISYEYDETAEGKWLAEHGHEYGFIIRYLPGKEDITGYNAEPWHIRYVGVGPATEIYEKGICFEEYLNITD